jgi:hypothetical protein
MSFSDLIQRTAVDASFYVLNTLAATVYYRRRFVSGV